MMKNIKIISIIGFLSVLIMLFFVTQKTSNTSLIKATLDENVISYADQITGRFDEVTVSYIANSNDFYQKEFVLDPNNNTLSKSQINGFFAPNYYQLSYVINKNNNDFFEINMFPRKNIINLKGFAPASKISLIQNNQIIFDHIATDWSGKISLDVDFEISNSLCLKSHSEDLQICHSPIKTDGGIS